jgi:hypothetical protein
MSAYFSRTDGDRINRAHFRACLPKPFTPDKQRLLNAMDAAAKKSELPRLTWVRTVIAKELENEGF